MAKAIVTVEPMLTSKKTDKSRVTEEAGTENWYFRSKNFAEGEVAWKARVVASKKPVLEEMSPLGVQPAVLLEATGSLNVAPAASMGRTSRISAPSITGLCILRAPHQEPNEKENRKWTMEGVNGMKPRQANKQAGR